MTRRSSATRLALAALATTVAASCAPTTPPEDTDSPPTGDGGDERTGIIGLRVLDEPHSSATQHFLIDENGDRVKLEFDEASAPRRGDEVTISGTLNEDGTFTVDDIIKRRSAALRVDGPVVRTPMHHTVAVLAHSDADLSEGEAMTALNAATDSAQHYFEEVSNGIDTFSGEIFRRYDVALNSTNCSYNQTDTIADDMIAAFEADGFDASDYDHIAVVLPRSCGSDWSGAWAYIGGIRDNGTPDFSRISVYKDNVFDPWFLGHELGHNLGMNHARSVDCGSPRYEADGAGCSYSEYGNYNDVMGSGEGVWFGAAYLRYLGWVGADHVVTAGRSDTFNLQPTDDAASCGIRALRVPVPDEAGSYFYIEYRRERSDSRYAGTGDFGSSRRDAVLITRSNDGGRGNDSSYTDRVELGTSRYNGASIGERYDLGDGVFATVESIGGETARVSIEMPGSGSHRDDDGGAVATAADGTVGSLSCGGTADECPNDPTKTEPGECGCGVPEGTCQAEPYIETSKAVYEVGEPVVVRFYNLPGNATDWIGTYGAGTANDTYLDYEYTDGASTGSMTFAGRNTGDYEARLFFNDSYTVEDQVAFSVAAPNDQCPADPAKTEPGVCGCGTPDTDSDRDGAADCNDQCPTDPAKTVPGECGCGVPDGTCSSAPRIEMSKETYAPGETIVVSFSDLPGNATDWVGLYRAGTPDDAYLDWEYSNGAAGGTMRFSGLAPGAYQARLYLDDSYDLEFEVSFTVEAGDDCPDDPDKTAPGECGCGVPDGTCSAAPRIEMSKATYAPGETIVVRFYDLPGNALDWVGTYSAGSGVRAYLDYEYTDGASSGTLRFSGRAAGNYRARLFFDDSYRLEYEVSFTVAD